MGRRTRRNPLTSSGAADDGAAVDVAAEEDQDARRFGASWSISTAVLVALGVANVWPQSRQAAVDELDAEGAKLETSIGP